MKTPVNCRTRHRGGGLIEVMVAVVILSFGLLGMAGLASRTVQLSDSAHYRSIAADLVADLADRVRANRPPYMLSDEAPTLTLAPPDFGRCQQKPEDADVVECSPQGASTATYRMHEDLSEWNRLLRSQLPAAGFTLVTQPGAAPERRRYKVTISWLDDRQNAAAASITAVIE